MSLANDFFSNFRSLIKSCGTLFSLFPQEGKGEAGGRRSPGLPASLSDGGRKGEKRRKKEAGRGDARGAERSAGPTLKK